MQDEKAKLVCVKVPKLVTPVVIPATAPNVPKSRAILFRVPLEAEGVSVLAFALKPEMVITSFFPAAKSVVKVIITLLKATTIEIKVMSADPGEFPE